MSGHIKRWYCSCHCVGCGTSAKNPKLTWHFFFLFALGNITCRRLGQSRLGWHRADYSLVLLLQGQSNASRLGFRRGQENPREKAHEQRKTLVWGILIKAWVAQKSVENLKKLQLGPLGMSSKDRIKVCWKYSQPCGGIFIVTLQQLVLGYSSAPVSYRSLLSNLVILHLSSIHRLIMCVRLVRPKAGLIGISRVQRKISFCPGSFRTGILNCTKCKDNRKRPTDVCSLYK